MKFVYGIIAGIAVVICCGMTYDITRSGFTENIVDIRIIELGGHEYVVATSFSPKSHQQNSSSSIALMHHVGCKVCPRSSVK